jgi:hypothetical protein
VPELAADLDEARLSEGDDIETFCVRCFLTKTFCQVSACIGSDFLGIGNSSSDPSIWMNSTILDGEALKILMM